MRPCPKPSRKIRVTAKADQRSELLDHRRKQYQLTASRDNDKCTFCWYLYGKRVKAVDVHHVYGRGKDKGSWRENYRLMLCTCRTCHPLPVYAGPGTSIKLAYVEAILARANENPINKRFKHVEEQ
jgi:hypothetical protein